MCDAPLPVIGIPACTRAIEGHPFNIVGEKYIAAAAEAARCLPLLIPSLSPPLPVEAVLDRLDGLLFTGSPSNVHPARYQGEASRPGTLHDEQRDATTLPLISAAIARGLPVFAICRGHQELNVALGGSLFQHVHEGPGRLDHRAPEDQPIEVKYGPAHPVAVTPGGLFERLTGEHGFIVNSLHGQAIDRLAPTLRVEATAPDGTIEAVTAPDAPGLVISVQWHPEWKALDNPVSMRLFEAFGAAARQHAAKRKGIGAHDAA
ncbi:gamma-glutamyl-gamma-aminobutyrate hydrolase family protein [Zavarzinia sp.]|uniref:gamma-glutamyl-gamma-aminobutyrate hydrolase family protein n=1 Tax=Zavarzinia sp. TaxID=2027920 RepID=UPI003BB6F9A5